MNKLAIGFMGVLIGGMIPLGYQMSLAFEGPDRANQRTWEYLKQFPVDITQTEFPIVDGEFDTSGHRLQEIEKQYPEEEAKTIRAQVDKIWEEERAESGNQLNTGFLYALGVGGIGIPMLAIISRKKGERKK
jgi:hypothetical protein